MYDYQLIKRLCSAILFELYLHMLYSLHIDLSTSHVPCILVVHSENT